MGVSLALSQALGLLGHALLPSSRKTPCSQKGGCGRDLRGCVCVHFPVSPTLHKAVMGPRRLLNHW